MALGVDFQILFQSRTADLRAGAGLHRVDVRILRELDALIVDHFSTHAESNISRVSDHIMFLMSDLFAQDPALIQKTANYVGLIATEIKYYRGRA
jgi:hypothetical protein